jgi:hypothetical protein
MNDRLRERLQNQVAPDHECTPYTGGCQTPHYWYNHIAPRYMTAWPEPSAARVRADEAREVRDWAGEE